MRRSFWLAQPACMQPTHAADGMQASHAPSCSRGPARPAYACVPVASPLNHLAARTSCAAPIARRPCLVAAAVPRSPSLVLRVCVASLCLVRPTPCICRARACGRACARGEAAVRLAHAPRPRRYTIQTGRAGRASESRHAHGCLSRVSKYYIHLLYPELRVCAVSCLCRLLVPVFLSALRKTRVRERQARTLDTGADRVTAHPRPDRRTATQTSGGHDRNKIHTHAIKLTQ